MRRFTKRLVLILWMIIPLAIATPAWATESLEVKDLKIEADVDWSTMMVNDKPSDDLQISLSIEGPAAAKATAHTEPKIESILDGQGKPVPMRLFRPYIEPGKMLRIDRRFGRQKKGQVKIGISSYRSPSIEKLSELRGSVDLRTGGRLETVIVPRALKRSEGAFDDASLKKLGLVVSVRNIEVPKPKENTAKDTSPPANTNMPSQGFTMPFGPADVKDKWLVNVKSKKWPLIECEFADATGKPFQQVMSRYDRSDKELRTEISYGEKLPDDTRLKLTVHVDPEILHVPFALKDIPVPPQEKPGQWTPLVPVPSSSSGESGEAAPETIAPVSPRTRGEKPSIVSAMKNALGTSMGLPQGPVVMTPVDETSQKPRPAPKELYVDRKSGKCTLKAFADTTDDDFAVEVGKKLKGTCRLYITDFFGKEAISAPVELKNKSLVTMYCHYYVVLFDKDRKFLGCASQGCDLARGDRTQLASCLVFLPEGVAQKAAFYEIVYYESDQPIGTPGTPPPTTPGNTDPGPGIPAR